MLAVVLARPEIPANVGFIARNMACHGLADLRIVGSPGAALHPDALRTSSGQEAILHGAREYADLASALTDCTHALAFSRRARDPAQRVLDLPEAALQFRAYAETGSPAADAGGGGDAGGIASGGRAALVFGCESQGLSREETFACSHVVRIPLPGALQSLNLSHAAAIALYAFHGALPGNQDMGKEVMAAIQEGAARNQPRGMGAAGPGDADGPEVRAAPKAEDPGREVLSLAESERLMAAVIAQLTERGRLRPAKAEAQREYLRILWQRLQPTRREAEFLAGLLKNLALPDDARGRSA